MREKRSYKQYPQAFKEEAVALVTDQGYSTHQAAEPLGIREDKWQAALPLACS